MSAASDGPALRASTTKDVGVPAVAVPPVSVTDRSDTRRTVLVTELALFAVLDSGVDVPARALATCWPAGSDGGASATAVICVLAPAGSVPSWHPGGSEVREHLPDVVSTSTGVRRVRVVSVSVTSRASEGPALVTVTV